MNTHLTHRVRSAALLIGTALAQVAARTATAQMPPVVPGRIAHGWVEFGSPVALNWNALRQQAWPSFDPTRIDSQIFIRNYNEPAGISDIPFSVPLTPTVPREHYYLLAPGIVTTVTPDHLVGHIIVDIGPGWSVQDISSVSGALAARIPRQIASDTTKMFVIWSPRPDRFTVTVGRISAGAEGREIVVRVGARAVTFARDSATSGHPWLRPPANDSNPPTAVWVFSSTQYSSLLLLAWQNYCITDYQLWDTVAAPRLLAESEDDCTD